jgi:hypothetical protein
LKHPDRISTISIAGGDTAGDCAAVDIGNIRQIPAAIALIILNIEDPTRILGCKITVFLQ